MAFISSAPSAPVLPRFRSPATTASATPRRARKAPPLAIAAAAAKALRRKRNVVFVDLRDWEVLDRTGWIEGALHCPPGEFATLIDPASTLHTRLFEPGSAFVFYGGPKSAPLAAARKARALGLHDAVALRGGMNAWRSVGGRLAGHSGNVLPVLKASLAIAFRYTVSGVRRRLTRLRRKLAQGA